MLRTQNLVPEYYPEQSRDFQVLGRLYDYTLNALKFNVDTMTSITDTQHAKDTILPLIGDKFGIYDKQSYSNRELLSALPNALFYKGSLKSVSILLNAYLDSLNIFDYAVAYHSKDEVSAKQISDMLSRNIKPYTIVIVLSIAPSLVELHVLNEYLRMILPCGMLIEYVFGVTEFIIDKFKYMEDVFVYYVKDHLDSQVVNKPYRYKITPTTPIPEDESAHTKFIRKVTSNIDINAVSLASVTGAPANVKNEEE